MKQMTYFKQALAITGSLFALVLLAALQVSAQTHDKKVLMIISGYGQSAEKENAEKGSAEIKEQPGYEFDEFSKAYTVFKNNGILVDIASPKGGKVKADQFDSSKSYNAIVLADTAIMAKLNNTLTTASITASDYDSIFIVGGKGAMFDLPKDLHLQQIIADIYQRQGSVAAVCHGPAALVNVKLNDGSYLIADKTINSFTNQEENLFGQKWINDFEFMLEDKLIERGAHFQSSNIMLSHVAIDGHLITGQNPTSTVDVANALVKNLGITPANSTVEIEDKTMAMVATFIAGDKSAITTLKNSPEQYHLPLVSMYGFYFLKVANSTPEFEQALTLMQVAQKALNNSTLDMNIAKTQVKLGQTANAKATLTALIATKPDYKPAQDMLKTL